MVESTQLDGISADTDPSRLSTTINNFTGQCLSVRPVTVAAAAAVKGQLFCFAKTDQVDFADDVVWIKRAAAARTHLTAELNCERHQGLGVEHPERDNSELAVTRPQGGGEGKDSYSISTPQDDVL